MVSLHSSGQGLLIIAMIVVVAALVLAMLYRVFIMTPAYVYQRSIYFVFKYNPQLVVQGLAMQMNTALLSFTRNYSQFLLNYGIAVQLPALQGGNLAPISLASILGEYYNTIINTVYTPTGLAIQTSNGYYTANLNTNYYGALSLLNYVYANNRKTTLYVMMNSTYDMPIIGIQNLNLQNTFNLTASIVKPKTSTCIGNVHTMNYLISTKCIFNFASNTYTCINPAFTATEQAMNLWAPYYNALVNNRITVSSNGITDANNKYADPVMFLYPIDPTSANYGFKVSAVFYISSSSNFLVGINFLAQYPTVKSVNSSNPNNYATGYWVNVYPSGNKYYYSYGGPGPIFSPKNETGTIKNSIWSGPPNPLNITVVVQCSTVCNPFNSSTGTATIYINGVSVGSMNVVMPQWTQTYSSYFNNYAYIMGGSVKNPVGPWIIVMLQNAAVISASVRVTNMYVLPTNVYVAVSLNNQPALGVTLNILNITTGNGVNLLPAQYNVCNITNNAIILNVTLPQPTGYPYNQYLMLLNYSDVVTLLNPFSPAALNYLGLSASNITAMAAYILFLYNPSSNIISEVPYVANTGIPTLLLFYNNTDISTYNGYIALTPVNVAASLSIIPAIHRDLQIYTVRESLIHVVTGYTPLNYTIPQGIINEAGLPTYYSNDIMEFYYSPSQTHESLPITYAPTTILNCKSSTGYVNYGLFLVRYGSYWGYCSYGSLWYSNGVCYPLSSSIGGC
jgi:hypothetical protein